MKSIKLISLITCLLALFTSIQAESFKVCTTTPELGNLARIIGGKDVELTVFVKGQEDPHAIVARPSHVKKLSRADALIISGLGLEAGWIPALIQRSRNSIVFPGKMGYIDASAAITPIHPKTNIITRAMGDVHPEGNPHYMLDPISGLKVARHISSEFSKIKPLMKDTFAKNLKAFEAAWAKKAFGEELIKLYSIDQLIKVQEIGKLSVFLEKTGQSKLLKGWFGKMAEIKGAHLVTDHDQWAYFAKRFEINIDKAIEPKPGVPPGNRHLKHLIEWIKAHKVKGLLASPYYSPRHISFVQKRTGVQVLAMAHQVGARPQARSYLSMLDHNINLVCECCKVN